MSLSWGAMLALTIVALAAVLIGLTAHGRLNQHEGQHRETTRKLLTGFLYDNDNIRGIIARVARSVAKDYLQEEAEKKGEAYKP